MNDDTLARLTTTIATRRQTNAEDSYVASLNRAGLNRMLEKIGEEATEVILAAKDVAEKGSKEHFIGEVADLWFHCMVVLDHMDSDADAVLKCLEQRLGLSGLEEKASRVRKQ